MPPDVGVGHGRVPHKGFPFYEDELADLNSGGGGRGRGRGRGRASKPPEQDRPGRERERESESETKLAYEELVAGKTFENKDGAEKYMKTWSDDNLNPLVKVSVQSNMQLFILKPFFLVNQPTNVTVFVHQIN